MSASKPTLLLVEDEESIGEGLSFNFKREGFEVVWKTNGQEALDYINENLTKLNVIVLDLMLPEVDGFSILEQTRNQADRLPILVLSAKSFEMDKVRALALGADDYVTKPFSLPELILRLHGLLKRSTWLKEQLHGPTSDTPLAFASGTFFPKSLIFEGPNDISTKLSPTEASLLTVFSRHENTVLSRNQLLKDVWEYQPNTETRTVDVFVSKLRRVAEKNEKAPEFILSVRGRGYVYVTDPEMRDSLVNKKVK